MKFITPLILVGGKSRLAEWVISHFPQHKYYVEVFGGTAAVLMRKPKSEIEIYNDINNELANFWLVVSKEDTCKELFNRVELLPKSKFLFEKFKKDIKIEKDNIQRALMFFYINRNSFGGRHGSSFVREVIKKSFSFYHTSKQKILNAYDRFKDVTIENDSFEKILTRYDSEEYLAYLDPPYVPETCGANYYDFEMTFKQHEKMVELLNSYKGSFVVSGYDNELYNRRLNFNKKVEKKLHCVINSVKKQDVRNTERIEVLWIKDNKLDIKDNIIKNIVKQNIGWDF